MTINARFWLWMLPAAGLMLSLTASAIARQAIVKLDDGRQIRGELVAENAQEVILEIAGIRTTFERQRVTDLEYVKSVQEQYQERRSQIADDDLDKRYELVRWLFENKGYTLAKAELADLIERYPRDSRLVPMQNLIDARLKLLEEPQATPTRPERPRPERPEPGQPAKPAVEGEVTDFDRQPPAPRFTDEQINLMRVYEINTSTQPNVHVPNDVMEEVYKRYPGEEGVPVGAQAQRQALGAPGWRKLQLLFQLKARDLYPRVVVHTEPQTIADFRTNVHSRYLLTYCATTNCHGGKDAGAFFAFRFEPASNATVYTNYYILQKYNTNRGYMIDREKPERSFLVQYGLPAADAAIAHPDVPGYRPLFRNIQDPRAQSVLRWIASLGVMAMDYPIEYTIPTMKGDAPQPAPAATPLMPPATP